jgi:hypothetical protein
MADWLERWRKRQREIAEGTDADLVQANRTRFRVAFSLVGVGFILMVLGGKLHLTGRLDTVLRVIAQCLSWSDSCWGDGREASTSS